MKQRNDNAPMLVGGSSLLVIFAALCLTAFALLTMSTGKAGSNLTAKSTDAVASYYRADCEAERILAQLRAGTVPERVREENGKYAYECSISTTQNLEIEIEWNKGDYRVLRWQTVNTGQWQADDSLNLWTGE